MDMENAKILLSLIKERFHGTTADTFDKFQHVLLKFGQESETVDTSTIVSEVSHLFTEHNDLIEKFTYFLHNNRRSVRPDKKSVNVAMTSSVDFIEKVKRVLNDDDKFYDFFMIVTGFQQHKDVERVRREAFCLFKEHPELKSEFCEFLDEKIAGRTVQDMVVSKKRKREEAQDSTDRCKGRKYSPLESKKFVVEDRMYNKSELAYNFMLRAKECAERLITDNSGRKYPKDISIAGYFRGLDVKFMREELKLGKFLEKGVLLSEKSMEREYALTQSRRFVRCLEKKIDILIEQNWDERKKSYMETAEKETE